MIRKIDIARNVDRVKQVPVVVLSGNELHLASDLGKASQVTLNPRWEEATHRILEPDYTPINVGPEPVE